jgi:hypothetical protein
MGHMHGVGRNYLPGCDGCMDLNRRRKARRDPSVPIRTACVRCGIERSMNSSRPPSPLCRDCKSTMSLQEQILWAA